MTPMNHIYSPMIEEQIKKDFDISKPTKRTQPMFEGCWWWSITTGHLHLSIYFDPSDCLGYVGAPYYELYDGDDTYRYLLSDDPMDLILELHKQKAIYIENYNRNPEVYL